MSFSNIKHRFQHPVLYVHFLLIVPIQFAFVECYLSSLDNIMWNISSTPVIFGNTTELSCYIADGNSSCSDGLRQWIGGQQYTSLCQNMKCSDDTKYHVKVDKPCSYTLMISNFSMYDVNCYYTCFYGIQSYRKKLQLNNNYFISFPRVIHKNVSLTRGVIDIQLYMKYVFPIPKCHAVLVGENITNSLIEKTSTDEYFYDVELYMFHRIDQCNGNITIYCKVGNEQITVMHEFIGNCTDMHNSQGIHWSAQFAAIIAGIAGIALLCFGVYLWRKHRQRTEDYEDNTQRSYLIFKPSAPVGPISISNINESSAVIKWQEPNTDGDAQVEKYLIEYKPDKTSTWIFAGHVDSTTYKFSVNDLEKGQHYYFRITAINCKGPGSPLESIDPVKLNGSEQRYFARVLLLGKNYAGKTSLLRRLLKEDLSGVLSTDGVDIVVRQCKINIKNGKWDLDKDLSSDTANKIHRTKVDTENETTGFIKIETSAGEDFSTLEPCKPMVDKLYTCATDSKDISDFDSMYTSTNDIDNVKENEQVTITDRKSCLSEKGSWKSSSIVLPTDVISQEFSTTSTANLSSNQYASCELWDFAGEKEFYAIHQTFLTKGAVYLLVADIGDDISKQVVEHWFAEFCNIGEYVDFWLDNIHYQHTANTLVNKPCNGIIYPHIVMVFTGKDKYEKVNTVGNNLEDRKNELIAQLQTVLGNCSKDYHLRNIFWLSNKTDPDEEFEKLRLEISAAAMSMNSWGAHMPLKWIRLERLIEVNKNDGKNFISLPDMFRMAKLHDINMLDAEEMLSFLRFQHELGNIIFFEDIQDFIILNPQWLVAAFRCLVSDEINNKSQHQSNWRQFKITGEMSKSLINEIFKSKCEDMFSELVEHLVNIMLKFDILVEKGKTGSYVMPSMIPSASFDYVCKEIGIEESKCTRTSWLCLKFTFLPPAFFNHISVSFLRMYEPTKINSTKHSIALFRGICLFDIDVSRCTKLLVTLSTDTIALQLLSFSSEEKNFGSICSNIRNDVFRNTKTISQRYKLNLSYELHFKCNKGHYFKNTVSYQRLKSSSTFVCNDHNSEHQSAEIYMPWMMNIDEIQ